jgi:hypothetical protein
MSDITRARHWRQRAEELRTIADGMRTRSVQENLRDLAADLDRMADRLERGREGGSLKAGAPRALEVRAEGAGKDMKKSATTAAPSPSRLIDARIKELGDWRGEMLSHIRALIRQADPDVVEEWKWRGVPVWSHDGIICTGESYKSVVKLTFLKGASLRDPSGLFNASLDGNARRAIDLRERDHVDAHAFKALIRAAVALNTAKAR